jgi:hypothetical protein
MKIAKLKQKIGQLAIVEVGKSVLKTAYYSVEIVECTECHKKYPAFNFEILFMWSNPEDPTDPGVCYCRKCYNKIVADDQDLDFLREDYYVHFNPFRHFIDHFEWNWGQCVKRALDEIKYRKIRKNQVVHHD